MLYKNGQEVKREPIDSSRYYVEGAAGVSNTGLTRIPMRQSQNGGGEQTGEYLQYYTARQFQHCSKQQPAIQYSAAIFQRDFQQTC